ncbi:MAG: hypothetical protein ACSW77_07005 [Bacteroidales bacterium]
MKDYLNNGERDQLAIENKRLERENFQLMIENQRLRNWLVYGIAAPIVFMLILGMGEVIGRLFG